jgi:hypothetical protein
MILFLFDDGIACLFPGLNASTECHRVLIARGNVFSCLTGSARFFVSGTVEDDLLVLRQGGEFGLELIERNCSLELQLPKLRVVLIGTHKKSCARLQLRINLFWTNPFWLWHDRPPLLLAEIRMDGLL